MKHFITAALIAIALASPVRSDELFGYRLFTDIRNYHKDLSAADQHIETSAPYNGIRVDPIISNMAFSEYWLDYSRENFLLHSVTAAQDMVTMDYCVQEMERWTPRLEGRFGVSLTYNEFEDGGISSRSYYADRDGDIVDVRCNLYYDNGGVTLFIIWRSDELWDEIASAYDGF